MDKSSRTVTVAAEVVLMVLVSWGLISAGAWPWVGSERQGQLTFPQRTAAQACAFIYYIDSVLYNADPDDDYIDGVKEVKALMPYTLMVLSYNVDSPVSKGTWIHFRDADEDKVIDQDELDSAIWGDWQYNANLTTPIAITVRHEMKAMIIAAGEYHFLALYAVDSADHWNFDITQLVGVGPDGDADGTLGCYISDDSLRYYKAEEGKP